jgi:predicted Zn-dependent protease
LELPKSEGLKLGVKSGDVAPLKGFLKSAGYLEEIDAENEFDDETNKALVKYQRANDIPDTGVLDARTLDRMWVPSCSYSIAPTSMEKPTTLEWELPPKGQRFRWNKTMKTISWAISKPKPGLHFAEAAMQFAVNEWKKFTPVPFDFVEGAPDSADIRIYFDVLKNRVSNPKPNEVAATFNPINPGDPPFSIVLVDQNPNWVSSPNLGQFQGTDLIAILAHEMGHALGLGHSKDSNSLMYFEVPNGRRTPQHDEAEGIKFLYQTLRL